jgi:hypothetical protein
MLMIKTLDKYDHFQLLELRSDHKTGAIMMQIKSIFQITW